MEKLITPYCEDFGKSNIVIKHFPDNESYVFIPKIEAQKDKKITIYHRLYPEQDKRIFELMLILSRLQKETKDIELFAPYLPYARQDRKRKEGEVVSADVLCELLKNYGVKKLITYDCHFLPKPGNFTRAGLAIENKSAGPKLYAYAKKYFDEENKKNNTAEEFVVVSPDEGSSYFIENAKGQKTHSLTKTRGEAKANGEENGIHADIHTMEGEIDVEGKNVCILDDIISTGGKIIRAIEHLKARGAKKIIVGATHGVFAGHRIAEKILNNSC
ncbi:MAG: ribose-phosphate diphosphokinase, partial [Patescibacteria group bacterium]